MHKVIPVLTLAIMMTATTALASPVTEFEKGAVSLEVGSTINSRVTGKGQISADVTGKSGFKAAVTTVLNDHLALQYKQGLFKSADSTISGITTYAQAEPQDVNLLYKLQPHITLITGYENTKISYGKAVTAASKSALHVGLAATQKLDNQTTLFATLLRGQDVSLRELGVSYKVSKNTILNVSYAERKIQNMDLKVPVIHVNGKEDYTMTGITCMFNVSI